MGDKMIKPNSKATENNNVSLPRGDLDLLVSMHMTPNTIITGSNYSYLQMQNYLLEISPEYKRCKEEGVFYDIGECATDAFEILKKRRETLLEELKAVETGIVIGAQFTLPPHQSIEIIRTIQSRYYS